jgi:hypothetical protein
MADKNNVTRLEKNLHTDNSLVDQPKGTTRFVLNGVNETEQGDRNFIANEESNEICYPIPDGYILLGKTYIGNGKTAILSVSSDEIDSEIGIADDDCNYVTHVNDANSPDNQKLNFKISHQIDVIYRLRRGCENTIYFVDGDNNKPRYYNFDKPEQFQDNNGDWDSNRFELIRSYQDVPIFENIEVLDSGGKLEPGSYNVAIQYLDEDLNPTEWITTSNIINIFNDDLSNEYLDIRGSINSDTDYIDFDITNKSIKVELGDLDQSFLFYRLAFIEATNGTGFVSAVNYTENIPITKDFFIYTGVNFATSGTEEEIQAFQLIIDSAGSIEQIENRLILGNIRGKSIDFCKLQKYASRIKTDMITRKIFSNVISDGNPKSPTVTMEAAGYMPGEIYSFGIVYVFSDGSTSPVYHIPGKNPNTGNNVVFAPGDNVYPMSINNQSANNTYIDNDSCQNNDYWGLDYEGDALNNEPVRHHRFPLRSEIGLDLFSEESSTDSETLFYRVKVTIDGTISTPCTQQQVDDGDCSPLTEALPFQMRIEFTIDGVTDFLTVNIDPADYAGSDTTYNLSLEEFSNLYTSNNIVIVSAEESQDDGSVIDVSGGGTSPKGLTYTISTEEVSQSQQNKIYSTEVFGIQFSGVDLPDESDTNGEKVIGYYIVRNERTEDEKTILDSAAMFPTVINSKYTSHGLLAPELTDNTRVSKKVFGLIHPEHKFKDKKYTQITGLIQEGSFDITDRKKSKARYRDVSDGTSYDSSIHKSGGGRDRDGWSLKVVSRDNITQWRKRYTLQKTDDEIEDIFYLDALQSRNIEDDSISVFNIAGDNKAGILQLKDDYNENVLGTIPYLYMKRDILDSYSTFRTLPYYKASNNITDTSVTAVFGGDTYVNPIRYVNTVFWDNRIAERAGRTSVWNYIIGAILAVVGTILAFFTGGASTVIVGAGIAIIGGGALFIASGVKRDALVRAYNDEYDRGLRETALDDWTNVEYRNMIGTYNGSPRGADTPEDDEIQWIGDCITNLWFESQINLSLRNGFSVDTPTFMDAPGKIEEGYSGLEPIYEHFDVYKISDQLLAPTIILDRHLMAKLSVFSPDRGDSREYIGHPLGEYYNVNPDYERINKQKIYNHLGIEYDCCSDCQEEFPHRVHYSEQSFQEELTDNYRVFLPNNYRDIEGEKGIITNLYRMTNNLYIHTEEALWHLPQNYQERVTNDIVSFIGTGSYFETPPRLIVDDSKTSAGTQHKWGAIKTKHGILFPSQIEKKWYLFNGNELKPISDYGNSNWFKENMHSIVAQQYYASNGRQYPYLNNPSNPYGEGFISTYDTKKERLIMTKRDFTLNSELVDMSDYELCFQNDSITVFENYEQTIQEYEDNGYSFIGIEDCRMKFSKVEYEEVEEEREIIVTIPNTADIHVFFDTSGSFGTTELNQLDVVIDDWVANFAANNPDWTGTLFKYNDSTERWLNYAQIIGSTTYAGQNLAEKDIIVISFCNESEGGGSSQARYHGSTLDGVIEAPGGTFLTDYDTFTGSNLSGNNPSNVNLHDSYNSFLGIHYPVVFSSLNASKEFLAHSLAALKGVPYTVAESANLNPNPGLNPTEQATLITAITGTNPYPDDGLENYGWLIKEDRFRDGSGNVIDSETFQEDINELLLGNTTTETITVTVQVATTVFEYVDGTVLDGDLINHQNSWTMSFDLKEMQWIGWHSYIPNMYFYISEKFYGWKYGNNNIWKFNRLGHYQTYFGVYYPHIVEYVSLSNPLITKLWDWLILQTEAKQYLPEYEDYVDKRFITHNKIMLYNTRQHSGLLNLVVKEDLADENYMNNQINNNNVGDIIIDRTERNWTINDFRDIRVNYDVPMFNKTLASRQLEYFIDKVINDNSVSFDKDWTQLESFRDKFLVIRLIFDNFDNIRIITNYSVEPETNSIS